MTKRNGPAHRGAGTLPHCSFGIWATSRGFRQSENNDNSNNNNNNKHQRASQPSWACSQAHLRSVELTMIVYFLSLGDMGHLEGTLEISR